MLGADICPGTLLTRLSGATAHLTDFEAARRPLRGLPTPRLRKNTGLGVRNHRNAHVLTTLPVGSKHVPKSASKSTPHSPSLPSLLTRRPDQEDLAAGILSLS